MITIILIVIAVIIVLKFFKMMGRAAPIVLGYGFIFWLHSYIGFFSWILAAIFTLGVIKLLWNNANGEKDNKKEWM